MTGIFVSYRRADAAGWVGRLVDAIKQGFPTVPVFHDLSAIKGGEDFADVIGRSLGSCKVLLALIGPRWLTATGERGERRLDDPEDFVRMEVKTALERGVYVVPVLLGGAQIPRREVLPPDLASLARRQTHEISDSRWEYDCDQLLGVIEAPLGVSALRGKPGAAGAISVGSGLVIRGGSRVGDIVGVKVAGGGGQTTGGSSIDVLRDATIEESEIGDVAGVKEGSSKADGSNAK